MLNHVELHCHTHGSNLRMRDSIIKTKDLIDYANGLGCKAVAITDHGSISEHIKAMIYAKELRQKGEKIKVLYGDEIYLVDSVEEVEYNYVPKQTKFYHFLLIAKNDLGYEQLRRINAEGWKSSFKTGRMVRVPNDRRQIEEIIGEDKGNIIALTACIGGELAIKFLNNELDEADEFIQWCIKWFTKECFAIEIQPSLDPEQVRFNKWAIEKAKEYGLKFVVTNDVHYLKEEHHDIHRAFRYSTESQADEEEDFYKYTWMMPIDRKRGNLYYLSDEDFNACINNGWELVKDCEFIDMEHTTIIPERDLSNVKYQVKHIFKDWYAQYPYIEKFAYSEFDQDRFLLSEVEKGFLDKGEEFNKTNLERINWEMEQLWIISDNLKARMSAYYNLVDYIVDICWEIGFIGISRGSVTGWYLAYLTDIQQMNPIKWNLPAYRHLNAQRISWPKIYWALVVNLARGCTINA